MIENILFNKSIMITGASSGIGKGIATMCDSEAGRIILTGRSVERLNLTLSQMKGEGNVCIPCDLTKKEELVALVEQLPKLDGLVLCAGQTHTSPAKFNNEIAVWQLFETNILSSMHLIRLLLQKKKLNNGASIVFISSLASIKPYVGNSLYSATKGAVNSFSKVLALELAPKRIRVNCVLPGIIRTKEVSVFTEDEMRQQEEKIPLGFGKVVDIANACVYLLSDYANWITGTEIVIDGGQSLS